MEPISLVHTGEPFLLLCEIKNESEFPITFKTSGIKNHTSFSLKQAIDMESVLKNGRCCR